MHQLIGHAIVSADDCIADAQGEFPPALKNDADWQQFQAALDAAALTLIGRASHEMTPNVKQRPRLIVSRRARGLERRIDGWWWNPDERALGEVLTALVPEGGIVAVPGGQGVFELIGAAGFAEFHLARARGVDVPGGRGIFAACEGGVPAADVLAGWGLKAGRETMIDRDADVSLTIWRRRRRLR